MADVARGQPDKLEAKKKQGVGVLIFDIQHMICMFLFFPSEKKIHQAEVLV